MEVSYVVVQTLLTVAMFLYLAFAKRIRVPVSEEDILNWINSVHEVIKGAVVNAFKMNDKGIVKKAFVMEKILSIAPEEFKTATELDHQLGDQLSIRIEKIYNDYNEEIKHKEGE